MNRKVADRLISSFEPLFSSLVKHHGLENNSRGLTSLKGALLIFIECHNARRKYSDGVILASSGVVSLISLKYKSGNPITLRGCAEPLSVSAKWLISENLFSNEKEAVLSIENMIYDYLK